MHTEVAVVTVFRTKNLRFQIYTDDHKPPHVHVIGPGVSCKITLVDLAVMKTHGFSQRELKRVMEKVVENRSLLMYQWENYHG